MINITLAGRTSKYVTLNKVDTKKQKGVNQAVFTVFSKDQQGNTQTIKCVYTGISDETFKALFISKGKDDKDKTIYHSRMVYIQGRLGLEKRPQQLCVVGFDDVFEEVLAPSPAVYVSTLEFLDASPDKKKEGSNANMTDDDKEAKRKAIEERKKQREANANKTEEVNNTEETEEVDEEEVSEREIKGSRSQVEDIDEEPISDEDFDFDMPYGAK